MGVFVSPANTHSKHQIYNQSFKKIEKGTKYDILVWAVNNFCDKSNPQTR